MEGEVCLLPDSLQFDPVRINPDDGRGRNRGIADCAHGFVQHAVAQRNSAGVIVAGEPAPEMVESVEKFEQLLMVPHACVFAAGVEPERHVAEDHGELSRVTARFKSFPQILSGTLRQHAVPLPQLQPRVRRAEFGGEAHIQSVEDDEPHLPDGKIIEHAVEPE